MSFIDHVKLLLVAIFCLLGTAWGTRPNIQSMKYVHYVQEGDDVILSCSVSCEDDATLYPQWRLQVPWYDKAHLFFLNTVPPNERETLKTVFDDFNIIQTPGGIKCLAGGNETEFQLRIAGVKTGLDHSVLQCGCQVMGSSIYYYPNNVMYVFVNKTVPEVTVNKETYYATPSGVRIECTHTCGRSSQTPITYLWRLRMLGHTHQEVLDLHNATIRASLEQELGVRVNMTAEGCEGNGNTSSFYLDIVGMSGRLQHALVTCGVRTDHQDLYSHTHSYIVINRTEVGMTKEVNEAGDKGEVVIECTHTCTGGAEPEYLWQLRMYRRDMLPQNLHEADVRSRLENQLGIDISMMEDRNGICDGGNRSRRSFYLKMSGLGISLNHSVVSCGVRQNNIYTVYSQQDSYILTKGEDEKTTHTTFSSPVVASVVNRPVFASSVVAAILFGLVCGCILTVMMNFFKNTVFQACQRKPPESPAENTSAFPNTCYHDFQMNPSSPTSAISKKAQE